MLNRLVPTAAALLAAAAPALAQDAAQRTQPLKVRKVVLYKHGVGYFEREGQIDGDVLIPLKFKTSQMPDVLKSLFAVHTAGQGRIGSIVYDSKDPLAKQLADIMVDVPDGNALTLFLRRLKGAPVELTLGGAVVRGHVMGIEPVPVDQDGAITTSYKVVLLGDDGTIRPVELLDASGIRLLDPAMQRDLRRMMEIYAKARHADRKVVQLRSTGAGPRTVRVGYIVEQPIWKTTYRLILEPGEKPLLQGWAIVENRTDEDWDDVALTFVAGSPLSFLMDLYTSYYPRRPVVGVQSADSTGGEVFNRAAMSKQLERLRQVERRKAARAPMAAPAEAAADKLMKDEQQQEPADARALGKLMAASLTPATVGAEAGELFTYTAKSRVAIKRGQAALVPILLESLEGGERILYFREDLSRHPQHAFLCKNSSTLTLEKGPVTVFEGSTCQGESLLQKVLKPNMHAVLPYAVETAVEIDAKQAVKNQPVTRGVLARGILTLHQSMWHEKRYTLREKAGTARVVYLDHPRTPGTELSLPAKAADTTPAHYRFRVELKAGETATLVVRETRQVQSTVRIANVSLQQIQYYLSQPYLSDGARQALQAATAVMGERAGVWSELRKAVADRKRLEADHDRVRRSLNSFRTGADERALRDKYLTKLVGIDRQIDALDQRIDQLTAQQQRLDAKLAATLKQYEE